MVVDLEAQRVLDLLPERTVDATATWLAENGPPEIVCRDRGRAYAEAGRQAAPGAVQIADRFHLTRKAAEVLERVLARHRAVLRAATRGEMPPPSPPTAETPTGGSIPTGGDAPVTVSDPRRERRRRRYEVVALHTQGWPLTAISRHLGLSRPTVRKSIRVEAFPEWAPRRTLLRVGSPHTVYLQERWAEGCRDATCHFMADNTDHA